MGSGNSADKPEWMREPSLKDIPVDKLDFLQKMVFESKTLSQKELMPFLMLSPREAVRQTSPSHRRK